MKYLFLNPTLELAAGNGHFFITVEGKHFDINLNEKQIDKVYSLISKVSRGEVVSQDDVLVKTLLVLGAVRQQEFRNFDTKKVLFLKKNFLSLLLQKSDQQIKTDMCKSSPYIYFVMNKSAIVLSTSELTFLNEPQPNQYSYMFLQYISQIVKKKRKFITSIDQNEIAVINIGSYTLESYFLLKKIQSIEEINNAWMISNLYCKSVVTSTDDYPLVKMKVTDYKDNVFIGIAPTKDGVFK